MTHHLSLKSTTLLVHDDTFLRRDKTRIIGGKLKLKEHRTCADDLIQDDFEKT